MAQSNLIVALFFLFIMFSQAVQFIEGRNLGFTNKNEIKTDTEISIEKPGKSTDKNNTIATECTGTTVCGDRDAALQAPPSPVVGGSNPATPGHADNFRPTTPGHSPGIRHSL